MISECEELIKRLRDSPIHINGFVTTYGANILYEAADMLEILKAVAFRDTLEQNEEPVVKHTQMSEEDIAVLLTETFADDTLQSDDLALIRAVERYHGITKDKE